MWPWESISPGSNVAPRPSRISASTGAGIDPAGAIAAMRSPRASTSRPNASSPLATSSTATSRTSSAGGGDSGRATSRGCAREQAASASSAARAGARREGAIRMAPLRGRAYHAPPGGRGGRAGIAATSPRGSGAVGPRPALERGAGRRPGRARGGRRRAGDLAADGALGARAPGAQGPRGAPQARPGPRVRGQRVAPRVDGARPRRPRARATGSRRRGAARGVRRPRRARGRRAARGARAPGARAAAARARVAGVSAELATLARAALAGLVFTALASLAAGAAWPGLRRRFARAQPAVRARVAWLAACAPGLLPALAVALCLEPGALGALGLHADHCARHPDHAHLCLAHPSGALTPALAATLALAAAALCAAAGWEALALCRARRALARLGSSRMELARGVSLVESESPFAFTAGLLWPRVLVSSALARALAPAQLGAVIAHERAHARRREPLLRLAARLLSWAHLPAIRRALLGELALASEQACDAAAARRVGDRLLVAEAILAVERLLSGGARSEVTAMLPAFGEGAVAERIEALLDPEPAPRRPDSAPRLAALAGLAILAALALADPLHHATEHLLGLLARLP